MRAEPSLVGIAHSRGPYEGETSLHLLVVNDRETELMRALKLVSGRLSVNEAKTVMLSQASGRFFHDLPMRHCTHATMPTSQ